MRSPAVAFQAPQRPISRTRSRSRVSNSANEDEYAINKRSSWLITQREPLPEIPARFLDDYRDSRPRLEQAHSSQPLSEAVPPARKGSRPASSRSVSTSHIQPTSIPATSSSSSRITVRDNSYDSGSSDVASKGSRNGIATERAARPTNSASSPRARRSFSSVSTTVPRSPRRKLSKDATTLAALTGGDANMVHTAHTADGDGDLFLQLAEDGTERAPTRSSWHGKRRSHADTLPSPPDDRRPRTSGQITGRPSSRIGVSRLDMHRNSEPQRYRATPRAESIVSLRQDDAASVSGRSRDGRPSRFSIAHDRSPMSPSRLGEAVKSPELPTFGRRRPSFGAPSVKSRAHRQSQLAAQPQGSEGESPAESLEPKRSLPESESVESNTAPSTVWDELDDLKSRIKKLELTGKMPSTSSAAVAASIEQSERPRTATTAPTTIDSSPKQERKGNTEAKAAGQKSEPRQQSTPVASPSMASTHPTLHAALAKAKTLLNASLYRTLEATANDALQLVALTNSAGPQGTTFSAASIINGVTVSDRHVRRKADTMCRNLTDLCLALCEGKHETPSSVLASPIAIDSAPRPKPPTSRYARSSIGYGEDASGGASRPMSRLEARKSSILGIQPSNSSLNSPQASADDVSASEQETTPSHVPQQHEPRRYGRAGSRLAAPRISRYDEPSGDEDPTVRPLSRAMTDIGSHRQSQHRSQRDYSNTSSLKRPERSPSLRDSLAARRANATSHEKNRVSSLTVDPARRRFLRESTPPVLEEDSEYSLAQQQPEPRRRIMSSGGSSGNQYSSRRAVELAASRSASLSQRRREMVVE